MSAVSDRVVQGGANQERNRSRALWDAICMRRASREWFISSFLTRGSSQSHLRRWTLTGLVLTTTRFTPSSMHFYLSREGGAWKINGPSRDVGQNGIASNRRWYFFFSLSPPRAFFVGYLFTFSSWILLLEAVSSWMNDRSIKSFNISFSPTLIVNCALFIKIVQSGSCIVTFVRI